MKRSVFAIAGFVCGLGLSASALAEGSFQEHYTDCVDKFAPGGKAGAVMLECTAAGGKLGACKVVDDSAPGKGFDKAAICVAGYLPVGSKSGLVRVPVHFLGA